MTVKQNGKVIARISQTSDSRQDLNNTFSSKHHTKSKSRPHYKSLYENQLKNNKGLLFVIGVLAFVIIGGSVGLSIRSKSIDQSHNDELEALSDQIKYGLKVATNYERDNKRLETELASFSAQLPKKKVSTGKVSYYSHDGCLGCGEKQITASGEPFNETAMTLAIPVEWKHIKMGTMATVTNLDNGKTVTAKVNDRGGFLKYGRIADLSKGLYEALGAKTDKSIIEIAWY